MQKTFTIQLQRSPPFRHNQFSQFGYPNSHPFKYTAREQNGWLVSILSKRDDYKDGQQITIDCSQIGMSDYFLDNSPAPAMSMGFWGQPVTTGPKSGSVSSDVIVMVDFVNTKNGQTEVSGEIFYVDPQLKGLPSGTLRDAFKDKAKITVLTYAKQYNFHAGKTFIFEKLRDVTVTNGKISATDDLTPKPGP